MATAKSALLRATDITKSYAGVQALKSASLELRAGEVHALIGENGAGKSTLIKIITGAVSADGGELRIEGGPVTHNSPRVAKALGVAAIYQQPALFPELTVAENIALGVEQTGMVGPRRLARAAPARRRAARAGGREDRPGRGRGRPHDAAAAVGRDRARARRRREGPDPRRADRLALRRGHAEPLQRHPRTCASAASAWSTSRTVWKSCRSSPTA